MRSDQTVACDRHGQCDQDIFLNWAEVYYRESQGKETVPYQIQFNWIADICSRSATDWKMSLLASFVCWYWGLNPCPHSHWYSALSLSDTSKSLLWIFWASNFSSMSSSDFLTFTEVSVLKWTFEEYREIIKGVKRQTETKI